MANGTCDACGTLIRYGIKVEPIGHDGLIRIVGATCANKVGLSADAIRQYRWASDAAQRAERRAENEERLIALHGIHGTDVRYISGCRCSACIVAAPHGTMHKALKCQCEECLASLLDDPSYELTEVTVLVDISTIAIVATIDDIRHGEYGAFWVVNDRCISAHPKRRSTIVNKGYTEVLISAIVRHHRKGGWSLVHLLSDAKGKTDVYGVQLN
jgi:hypothetical protein